MTRANSHSKTRFFINSIGWIGVALILFAYSLLSLGIIVGQSYTFQVMMLIGSLAIALEAWYKRDMQPMVLNIIFMVISLCAIVRIAIIL
jgi:hypothetical protein